VVVGRDILLLAVRATHTHNTLEYAAIALASKHINKYAGTLLLIISKIGT